MERPIGDVFKYEGTKLMVVPWIPPKFLDYPCPTCFFYTQDCATSIHIRGVCTRGQRSDYSDIKFVPVEDL